MKIKKGDHEIKLVSTVDTKEHLPLAYMHGDKKIYDCNIVQEFPASGIRKVIPYERFDSYEKIFFEAMTQKPETLKDLSPVFGGDFLKRDKNGYYYEPSVSTKFEPTRFMYHVIAKRTQGYSPQKTYNLKVSCVGKTERLADALIQVFADAPERGLVAHNVWVNSKDTSIQSLASRSLYENDILFIETKNGETYEANNEKINYDALLKEHVNIWLCCSEINLLDSGTANLSNSILYNETVSSQKHNFIKSSFSDKYLPAGGETITFFSGDAVSCVVKHYPGKGFIVISSDRFIESAPTNYKMIYEIIMQLYLQSYTKSNPNSGFVCDEPIDYIVKRNTLMNCNGFRSDKAYYEYFNSYSANDFKLVQVVLSDDKNVKVSHAPDHIYFEKISEAKDPKKPIGGYSVMLETHEVAFIDKWHYVADTQIDYVTERLNEYILLTLRPFCLNHVFSIENIEIKMPIVKIEDYNRLYIQEETYCIVYKDMKYICVAEKDWDKTGKLLLTAYINLVKAPIEMIDMRTRGGGLPENKRNNYNLLDIGHSLGRPFRKSGAFVIKLPVEAKQHHEQIMRKLEQISPAEKYYTIIYEQRGDIFEDDRL